MEVAFTVSVAHIVLVVILAYLLACYGMSIRWCRAEVKKICRLDNGDLAFWTLLWLLSPVWAPFAFICKVVFYGIK